MKRNEIKELQAKTTKELHDMLKKLQEELLDVRLELSQNKLKNGRQQSGKSDDIARILTLLQIKESSVGKQEIKK